MSLIVFALAYVLVMNLIGFSLMGIDKSKARKKAWRIPEATLFLFAICGGSLGSLIGMYVFHHKTRHWYFVVGMPLILIIQIIAVYMISRLPITITYM